jgi:hypothetical protein
MRIVALILVIWLIIGVIAGWQRHYYSNADANCAKVGDIVLTIAAGPLNYVGVNPKIDCRVPHPSR